MALLDRLRLRRGTVYYYSDRYGVQVANMTASELYRTQPNLRAVVSFLADNAAQIPLKVHERAADDDRPRVLDSPAARVLARPNEDLTPFELKRTIYSDLLLFGRSVVLVLPDGGGWQLRPIPAPWISGYEGVDAFAPEFVTIDNPLSEQPAVTIPKKYFVLFSTYDPNNPAGWASPVQALKDVLHEQVESNVFRRQMWQRGGRFNAYITRPKDVEGFTPEGFERFKRTWDESWAGVHASQGGSMPILEDGMEIKQMQFNSRDAQWTEAKKLGREDVAGVYHVNPALIWPGSGQTYASAKDNARALYNDTLAPLLMQVCDRINHTLLPMIGEPSTHYVAYDITIKTEGTFEEKIQSLQTATGAPILTRNEARAKLDLPAIDGGDELVVPLNVLTGGLASPYDTDPTVVRYSYTLPAKDATVSLKSEPKRFKAEPLDEDSKEMADTLREFFEHQRRVLLPKLGAEEKRGNIKADEWWDADRWNDELTAKTFPVALRQATATAKRSIEALGIPDTYSVERTEAYVESMCRKRAEMINDTTKRELDSVAAGKAKAKADDEDDEDDEFEDYGDVFDRAEADRSETGGSAFATAIAGWSSLEAVRQCAPDSGATKTWVVTSNNPRKSHAAMDGETVPYDQTFSNDAEWPGDSSVLDAADVANCRCQVELTMP